MFAPDLNRYHHVPSSFYELHNTMFLIVVVVPLRDTTNEGSLSSSLL